MEPKEKSLEIYEIFRAGHYLNYAAAKFAAKKAIEIVINNIRDSSYETDEDSGVKYWFEVKKEIENL